MTKEDNENLESSTKCWICGNTFVEGYIKVNIIVMSLENAEVQHTEVLISISV